MYTGKCDWTTCCRPVILCSSGLTHTLPYTCSDTFQTSVHKIMSPSLSGIRRPHQTSSWYCALCHRTFWCTGSKPVYPPHYQCTVGEIITHYPSGNPYQPSSSKKLLSPTFYITPGPSSGYYRMSVVKSHRRPFLHPLTGGQNVNWVIRRCWMEDISLVERLKCLGALKKGVYLWLKKKEKTLSRRQSSVGNSAPPPDQPLCWGFVWNESLSV